jgi:c-di-GMP-binding flagellar brake protein YcgR
LDAIRTGFLAGATVFLSPPLTVERVNGLLNFLRGPMSRERRRLARLPLRVQVDCTFGAFGENHFKAASLNIGLGGMLLEPSGGLRVGDELTLAFQIPRAAKPLRVRARIVRRDSPDRIGVEYLQLRERDREAINSYVTGVYKD